MPTKKSTAKSSPAKSPPTKEPIPQVRAPFSAIAAQIRENVRYSLRQSIDGFIEHASLEEHRFLADVLSDWADQQLRRLQTSREPLTADLRMPKDGFVPVA